MRWSGIARDELQSPRLRAGRRTPESNIILAGRMQPRVHGVTGVPRVPEPHLSWENARNLEGHFRRRAVPRVPRRMRRAESLSGKSNFGVMYRRQDVTICGSPWHPGACSVALIACDWARGRMRCFARLLIALRAVGAETLSDPAARPGSRLLQRPSRAKHH